MGQETCPQAALLLRCALLTTDRTFRVCSWREEWPCLLEWPQSGQEGPHEPISGLGGPREGWGLLSFQTASGSGQMSVSTAGRRHKWAAVLGQEQEHVHT